MKYLSTKNMNKCRIQRQQQLLNNSPVKIYNSGTKSYLGQQILMTDNNNNNVNNNSTNFQNFSNSSVNLIHSFEKNLEKDKEKKNRNKSSNSNNANKKNSSSTQ